jgi:cobalamin biosynthesis protein CobT
LSFKENYNVAKYRLGNIESECHNADGESLLYAYNRLQKEHTRRKIVFVLSDGEPCCGEHDYKIGTHLKKVVKDIRNNGDEVYAFGIGTKSPKEFYGENFFVYLEGINELGPVFFNRFKEVIAKTK